MEFDLMLQTRNNLISAHVGAMVVFTDPEGFITWVNPNFEKTSEYTLSEVIGRRPGEFLQGPATDPKTVDLMRRGLKEKSGFKVEVINYTKSGREYWVDISVYAVNENEKLVGYLSIQNNISNIKTLINEMLSIQTILHAVLNTAPLYVCVKDPSGRQVFRNKNYEQLLQFVPDKNLTDTEHQVLKTGERTSFEHNINIDGELRDLLTFNFPLDEKNGIVSGVGRVSIDMTERKRAERTVLDREQLYWSTIQSISDAVISLDPNFKIVHLNPAAEKLTGYLLNEAKGQYYATIFRVKSTEPDKKVINPLQCSLGKIPDLLVTNLLLVNRTGAEIPIGEGQISSINGASGEFAGLVLFFRDCSDKIERERLEKQIEVKKIMATIEGQEMERKRIAKELHDGLGQMLTLVKMKIDSTLKDKGKQYSKLIDDTIQESSRIAENLLPSKLRDFDLGTALNSLCHQNEAAYGIPIIFHSFLNSISLGEKNKIHLYRIAQEAINNALKHGSPKNIIVSLNEQATSISLAIEDDGIGASIGPRFDDPIAHHGLINMRERAQIMNGTFTIESKTGFGTIVIVEIPK